MSKSATLEVISIIQIDVSKTNPRKSFDEKSLQELSQSIKEHGILQPVLVRPMNDKEEGFEAFELVCGERRYRAALLAGLEEIPVNIRVLTDDEAFELQIIENLERKDVHPLDEADAFKKMLDSGKYTITDIAGKMAKPESFIVQRLKLVDLVEVLRDDFLAGHFGIGHAIILARCDEFKQFDIYEEAQPHGDNGTPEYGTVKELKETIEDDSYLLTEAKFDLTDAKLTDACACDVCPKRSGANPVLFEDMQEDRCFDQKCFDSKTEAFVEKEVAKIINEGMRIQLLVGYGKVSELIKSMCKQYEVSMLENYEYMTIERDNRIKTKGFYVSGYQQGKIIDIWILPKDESQTETESEAYLSTGSLAPVSNEIRELKEEISKIKSRQTRALELDDEKVWAEIRAIDTSFIKNSTLDLDNSEITALAYAMWDKLNWDKKKEFQLQDEPLFDSLSGLKKLMRIFYLDVLPASYGSHSNNKNSKAYYNVILNNAPGPIKEIETRFEEIAAKRIEKANERIAGLEAQIEALKPTEEPAAKTSKSKNK